MRVPHIINKNTLIEYNPSPESLELIGESERQFLAENFDWNKYHCPPLATFCVESIAKHYARNPILDLLPCEDRDHCLEILSPDLPLEVAIREIKDEYYWQCRYAAKFGLVLRRNPPNWTWKSLYLERHVQKILEEAQPQYNDEEDFNEILELCSPYVRRLIITQLQCWKPPLTMDKEDIPEEYPIDHINFLFILRKLPNISEFDIVYGMNSVGEDFNWNMFKISVTDCKRLGKALLDLPELKILRIHKSKLEYLHCQAIAQNIIKSRNLVELDLSHCEIGDQGALCIAKVVKSHNCKLKILNLSDNLIREKGVEGLGFSLTLPDCTDLEVLNLGLNPLGPVGVLAILRLLVRSNIPRELCISGCLFDDETANKVALMLKMNNSLKKLDIANNWLGEEGGTAIVEAMEVNKTLEWLDLRDTDVTQEQLMKVKEFLIRNQSGIYEEDEEIEEVNEEDEEKFKTVVDM